MRVAEATSAARSAALDTAAAPVLRQEVLKAQSASVAVVSGATSFSQAYIQSLQTALEEGASLMRAGYTVGDARAEEATREPDRDPVHAASLVAAVTPARVTLAGILALATFLDIVGLNTEGYANTYYAAAVKSMAMNFHNFFFASFDPGGFVAVDKPPFGLWLQVISVKLFGFSGVSMLLPQAIAGVASVAVIYVLVGRRFGPLAGNIAALAMAVTPVAIVDNRNNTSDSVLILLLLLAGLAVTRAAEAGRLRWLLAGGVLVGLAFNVKEIEAFMVLPALGLLYLGAAPVGLPRRLWHLMLAGFVTLLVSVSWIVTVDLIPAADRPFVSDSGTNSEISLALGYNGFGRLATGLLSHLPKIPLLNVKVDGSIVPGISTDIGSPGLLRLFRPEIGGQASWLLAAALLGLVVLLPGIRSMDRQARGATLFWGAWLLVAGSSSARRASTISTTSSSWRRRSRH